MENGMGHFGKLIQELPMIQKNDRNFREHFSEAIRIKNNNGLALLSSLNNYFIFQKK